MKTMLEVAYAVLKEQNALEFDALWDAVKTKASTLEGFETWPPEKQIDKKAEFYKIIILDGSFIRSTDSEWTLVENQSYKSLQKMKAFYAKEDIKE